MLGNAESNSDNAELLGSLKDQAKTESDNANAAAGLTVQARDNGEADKNAINSAASALEQPQADCAAEEAKAQAALTSLQNDYSGESEAITAAGQSLADAQAACDTLDEFGSSSSIIEGTNGAYSDLAGLATAANTAKDDAKSDYDAIVVLYNALNGPGPAPTDFEEYVAWFTIPTGSGPCRVEATVDQTINGSRDYWIFYLIGDDCSGWDIDPEFRRGTRYWDRHVIFWSGNV